MIFQMCNYQKNVGGIDFYGESNKATLNAQLQKEENEAVLRREGTLSWPQHSPGVTMESNNNQSQGGHLW